MREPFHSTWQLVKVPLRIAAGVLMILVGIVGLLLPILPGWVFIFLGLLRALPSAARLKKNATAETPFAARGLMVLGGITLKRGADCAVVDGAVAFTLEPK